MQIHKNNKKLKDYTNLRLIFYSTLFQEYEIKLPEAELIKILVADISEWMKENNYSGQHLQNNKVKVQKTDDLRRLIYEISVYKKIRQVYSKNSVFQVLQPFDLLIWKQKQHFNVAYTIPINKVSKFKNQQNVETIKKFYRSQLADYHSFNIIFQNIDQDCFCLNSTNGMPFLKLSRDWKIMDYQEGHSYWSDKDNPYSADFRKLQQAFEKVLNSKLEISVQQNQRKQDNQKLLQLKQIFTTIYQQSYEDFTKNYSKIFGIQFIVKNNKSLSKNLKQFYNLKNESDNLKQLINQQKTQYLGQAINGEVIQKLYQIELQEKIINQEYPCLIQKILYRTNKKQSLQNVLKIMSRQTKQDRVRWHFLKAKIQWKAGHFYRALAHLRQARNQTYDPKILYIVKFQQARNWQHLGQVCKAQADYKQSLAYAEQINIGIFPYILINLKCLYWKQGKIEQTNHLDKKIKEFKRINLSHKIAKTPQLRCLKAAENVAQIISSLMKLDKEQKILSKTQIMKLQIQRAPFLLPLCTHMKSILDKTKSQKGSNLGYLLQNSSHFLGEIKLGIYFLILLSYIQNKNQSNRFIQSIVEQIIENQDMIQTSNIKNYHRFLFLLSFYFQQKQPERAIKYIQTIIENKKIIYSKVVRFSLVKRLAQLYNQQNKQQKLLILYRSQNVIESGDLQCLFDFIEISAQTQHYSTVISSGIIYLNSIKQYQTESCPSKAKETGRLLNLSFQVRLLILRSFGKLRCYDEFSKIIHQLESDVSDRNKNVRLFIIQMVNLCLQMYQIREYELCYGIIKKISNYNFIEQYSKQSQLNSKLLFKQIDIKRLHGVYQKILLKMNIVANDSDFKWFKINSLQKDSQENSNSDSQKDENIQAVKVKSVKHILQVLNYQLKQRQPNYINVFQQFHILFTTYDTQILFGQLVDQIIIIGKKQGIKCNKANIMHIILLNTSLKYEKRAIEMYILFWLSSYKSNFELPEPIYDYWITKQGRDLRLDEFFFDYFEDRIQITECQNLQKLFWFQQIKRDLIKIKNQYKEIVHCQLDGQEDKIQQKIINFQINYRTYFDQALQQRNILVKMKEIMGQLDFPDDYL